MRKCIKYVEHIKKPNLFITRRTIAPIKKINTQTPEKKVDLAKRQIFRYLN